MAIRMTLHYAPDLIYDLINSGLCDTICVLCMLFETHGVLFSQQQVITIGISLGKAGRKCVIHI